MDDPRRCCTSCFESLKESGTIMLVKPLASDNLEDNLTPLGRIMFAASASACVLSSMACNGPALGAQAGQSKIAEIMKKAGFKRFRLTTQTQVNMVYEAKPSQT